MLLLHLRESACQLRHIVHDDDFLLLTRWMRAANMVLTQIWAQDWATFRLRHEHVAKLEAACAVDLTRKFFQVTDND